MPRTSSSKLEGYLERVNSVCILEMKRKRSMIDLEALQSPKPSLLRRSVDFFSNIRISLSCWKSESESATQTEITITPIVKHHSTLKRAETKNVAKWRKTDDELLLEATKKYAGNWTKISEVVSTKNASECFKRA